MSSAPISTLFSAIQAKMPVFSTRKALLVLNMQNDSFERHGDMIFCEKQEFRHEIDKIISHFRQMGDIVWIKTELDPISVPPSSTPISDATVSLQSLLSISTLGPGGSSMEQMNEETAPDHGTAIARTTSSETGSFHRKLKSKTWETDEDAEAYLKNTKIGGAPNLLAVPGTHGAELIPEMQAKVNLQNDLVIIKNRYSAFDGTQLLLSLRIKLVTHLYLTGCLTNISIYATAADAVRHGFEVTLVEDCLGYKSEDKHVEAMCKMADLLGVSGIDSNELIEEARDSTKTSSIAEQQTLSGTNKLDLKWTRTRDEFRDNSSPEKFISASAAPTGKDDTLSRSPFMIQNPLDNMSINKAKKHRSMVKASKITLGSDDKIGEGDSRIIFNVLSQPLAENSFTSVFNEVKWQIMRHRNGEVPRRVAVQGEIGNHEAVPLYRHPADESPPFLEYSPTVRKIRDELQIVLKQPFNHCLIQLYRDGQDNISEHSDKTLDIVRDSSIINLSLGAQRTMTLRGKKDAKLEKNTTSGPRDIQRVPMPDNSCFVLGWRTNQKWLHGVRADKRLLSEKSENERAYDGRRISLTFRNIGTFTNLARTKIWGQGAKSKSEATAGSIITNDSPEMDAMICAFGSENHLMDFDWDAEYGEGFDVLNLAINDEQV